MASRYPDRHSIRNRAHNPATGQSRETARRTLCRTPTQNQRRSNRVIPQGGEASEEDGGIMVKTGYKQTEIGVIPEDWEVVTLSVLCRSICDGTHFTPKYVHQGIPFYSVENITANDFTNTRFISQSEHEKLIKRCKPERGDILMTRITAGIIGDTRILDWDVNASIYVSLALLKLNERIVPEYLY